MTSDKNAVWILVYMCISVSSFFSDASSCDFPQDLRGVWLSSAKGFLRFNDSTLFPYPITVPGISSIDLTCVESNGTQYLLRSPVSITVFAMQVNLYLCLDIQRVNSDNYIYYVNTKYDPLVKEHVYAMTTTSSVNLAQACNLPSSVDNMYGLIKNVSANDISNIKCPEILRNALVDLSVEEFGVKSKCSQGVVDGCIDDTQIWIETDQTCSPNSTIPDKLILSCLFHKLVGDVTYIYTWTDNSVSSTVVPYGFICLEISTVHGTTIMKMFSDMCTDAFQATGFLTIEANDMNYTCQSTTQALPTTTVTPLSPRKKGKDNWVVYFLAVLCVVILAVLVSIIIIFYRKQLCALLLKDKQQEDLTFTNIEVHPGPTST